MSRTRLAIVLSIAAALCAQQILNNDSVIKLVHSGLGDELVVNMVSSQPGQYSLSPDDVIALKKAHVSDRIISAMVSHNSGGSTPGGDPGGASTSSSSGPLILHDGTPVRLRLSRNLTSAEAKTGDTIDFEVLDDVKANDVIVIPRNSTALGSVTEAKAKGRMGKGGKLDVAIDYARMINGDKVALRAVKETSGGGSSGKMTAGMVATSLIVWPAAPFFLFMHGKDSTLPKGTEITAYVNGDVKLEPSALRRRQ